MFLLFDTLGQSSLSLSHATAGTFNFDIPLSHSPKGKVTGSVGIRGIGSALVR
ncbi:2-hydroxyacid dehydrogenase [Cryptococcus neoformans]|nr:2-hydroxyacid dehydrogenase [Cryptococcus neoformans var. grubii c45]OXB37961.1 2-hydroxyacid dehydrogenase [Cryptococcus neoformans var. grubii]OXC62267.1 2-hydroxyacid dehydrogenase [Cryptococcus neoformans var. grubii MW-RSA852]